ncbi:unnamed protein product [Cylicostephanus goldi]|uniref:Uncharacterized protein n=1 Tax=Cylicostephanus goldi TaxID=71465 RepID=A0A3P7QVW4_CYLGO|nr:unnamed protein product [Cylicostephanus goldi]
MRTLSANCLIDRVKKSCVLDIPTAEKGVPKYYGWETCLPSGKGQREGDHVSRDSRLVSRKRGKILSEPEQIDLGSLIIRLLNAFTPQNELSRFREVYLVMELMSHNLHQVINKLR